MEAADRAYVEVLGGQGWAGKQGRAQKGDVKRAHGFLRSFVAPAAWRQVAPSCNRLRPAFATP
jgi:hypothetical protein